MATGNPRRVLIVDDNLDLAENIAEILQIDGHLTDIAGSAEDGLAMALKNEPDVIVTDYRGGPGPAPPGGGQAGPAGWVTGDRPQVGPRTARPAPGAR